MNIKVKMLKIQRIMKLNWFYCRIGHFCKYRKKKLF